MIGVRDMREGGAKYLRGYVVARGVPDATLEDFLHEHPKVFFRGDVVGKAGASDSDLNRRQLRK